MNLKINFLIVDIFRNTWTKFRTDESKKKFFSSSNFQVSDYFFIEKFESWKIVLNASYTNEWSQDLPIIERKLIVLEVREEIIPPKFWAVFWNLFSFMKIPVHFLNKRITKFHFTCFETDESKKISPSNFPAIFPPLIWK